MHATIALLLTLALCRAEHGHDEPRPPGASARRQLVQIVPVAPDGAPAAPAPAPSFAYILPASLTDSSDIDSLEDSIQEYGDDEDERERDGLRDEVPEGNEENNIEAMEVQTRGARDEEAIAEAELDDVREPTAPIELKWGGGERHLLRPAYHLSFVFGR